METRRGVDEAIIENQRGTDDPVMQVGADKPAALDVTGDPAAFVEADGTKTGPFADGGEQADQDHFLSISDVAAAASAAEAAVAAVLGDPVGSIGLNDRYAALPASDKAAVNERVEIAMGRRKLTKEQGAEAAAEDDPTPRQQAKLDVFAAVVDALERYVIEADDAAEPARS